MNFNRCHSAGSPYRPKAVRTVDSEDLQEVIYDKIDKYSRCGPLNVIQHIDIYGKFHATYAERQRFLRDAPVSISMCSFSKPAHPNTDPTYPIKSLDMAPKLSLEMKLSKLSTTTKTSSLYPGHDILSKRYKSSIGKSFVPNVVVPKM